MNVNKVVIAGRLTAAPEVRYTQSGKTVAAMSIAINRAWKTESGEKKEEVTFVNCAAWGVTAETMAKHLRRGSPVYVEGRLKLEQWEKDDQKHSTLSVVVESFQFVGKKSDAAPDPKRKAANKPATATTPAN